MKIEGIKQHQDKKDRFTVTFEDGEEIKVSSAQIADFGIYSERELSDEEYEELREALALSSAKARALRILGNRRLSAKEIEKRLISKGEADETARRTLEWLDSIGMIDDKEYAESIAKHYSSKGYGMARIKDELYKRGIDREMWEDALNCVDAMEESAVSFLEKKLRGSSDKDELRKAADALCRRGFTYAQARTAVKTYLETLDNIEEEEKGIEL